MVGVLCVCVGGGGVERRGGYKTGSSPSDSFYFVSILSIFSLYLILKFKYFYIFDNSSRVKCFKWFTFGAEKCR